MPSGKAIFELTIDFAKYPDTQTSYDLAGFAIMDFILESGPDRAREELAAVGIEMRRAVSGKYLESGDPPRPAST